MTLVAYLSHPIGDLADDPVGRHDNIRNAGEWLTFVVETTPLAILCPWLAYVTQMTRAIHAPRALVDQLTLVARCDVVLQVGGRLNPHMRYEQQVAERGMIPVVDLLSFGERPPTAESDRREIQDLLRSTVNDLDPRTPIGLSRADLSALRAAEEAMTSRGDEAAVQVIQRIVRLAMGRSP